MANEGNLQGVVVTASDNAVERGVRLSWQTPELQEASLPDLTLGAGNPGVDGFAN